MLSHGVAIENNLSRSRQVCAHGPQPQAPSAIRPSSKQQHLKQQAASEACRSERRNVLACTCLLSYPVGTPGLSSPGPTNSTTTAPTATDACLLLGHSGRLTMPALPEALPRASADFVETSMLEAVVPSNSHVNLAEEINDWDGTREVEDTSLLPFLAQRQVLLFGKATVSGLHAHSYLFSAP